MSWLRSHLLQISSVKRNSVVAVIGQTSSKSGRPCELWFFVADKKSSCSDAFIEGRYLYDAGRLADCDNLKEFEIHTNDDPIRLAKASVIDIIKDCQYRDGVYSIARSTISYLETIVNFEDDIDGKGFNRCIMADTMSAEISRVPDREQLLAALSNATDWKEKVIFISCFLQMSMYENTKMGQMYEVVCGRSFSSVP